MPTLTRVFIRWMIRRDMPEVLGIERASFPSPWTEDDFLECLRQRNCIGMMAEYGDRIVGFMIYELHRDRLVVLNFAAHPDHRRAGVGSQMAEKLRNKLSSHRRGEVLLRVGEWNLDGQRFFKAMGYRAVAVRRGWYPDTGEDAYEMAYRVPGWAEPEGAPVLVNRVSQYEES